MTAQFASDHIQLVCFLWRFSAFPISWPNATMSTVRCSLCFVKAISCIISCCYDRIPAMVPCTCDPRNSGHISNSPQDILRTIGCSHWDAPVTRYSPTTQNFEERKFGSGASLRGGVLGFKVLCECTDLVSSMLAKLFVCDHRFACLEACSHMQSTIRAYAR